MATVNCPQCGKPAEFGPSNRFRPFCDRRCRLIDLGAWASDGYRIPGDSLHSDQPNPEAPGAAADTGLIKSVMPPRRSS